MRVVTVCALAVGCAGDPLTEAWHAAIELERVERGDSPEASCDPELAEIEAEEPYLFLATSKGVPDIASLYWCAGPEACDAAPIGNVWLEKWTETELSGHLGVTSLLGGLCSTHWDGIDATRTLEGEVEVRFETFQTETDVTSAAECDRFLDSVIDEDCETVFRFVGTQVL